MIRTYFCRMEKLEERWFQQFLLHLSKERQCHIMSFQHYEDRLRSLFGTLMAKMELAKQLQRDPSDLTFQVNPYGKYELMHHKLYFNISHAGEYIVCAISDHPVGIDIEQKQQRNFSLFSSIWSEAEKKTFQIDKMDDFYYLWTAKESYVKWLGTGLYTDLHCIDIKRNGDISFNGKGVSVQVHTIDIAKKYQCAVCTDCSRGEITKVTVQQLKNFFGEIEL